MARTYKVIDADGHILEPLGFSDTSRDGSRLSGAGPAHDSRRQWQGAPARGRPVPRQS